MIENAILRIISNSTVKRSVLLRMLKEEGFDVYDRDLRKTVEEMITHGGYCIRSSEKGYKLITNETELNDAVEYLDKKSSAIAIRKNSLLRNFRNQTGVVKNQISLF